MEKLSSLLLISAVFFGAGLIFAHDAPLVLTHARVIINHNDSPPALGLRIENGRITKIYHDKVDVIDGDTVLNLHGATILPGLIDAHLHVESLGGAKRKLDLRGAVSKKAALKMISQKLVELSPGVWLSGMGWDENRWPEKEPPCARDLDAIAPDNPLWLERIDGHVIWLNSAAMKAAHINNNTVAPTGGAIRRTISGEPSGIFVDRAIDLIRQSVPEISDDELTKDLIAGMQACVAVGLTSVHDMSMSVRMYRLLKKLEEQGQVPIRIIGYLHDEEKLMMSVLNEAKNTEALVSIGGVKIFSDGSLGSHAAVLLKPYSDQASSRGLELSSAESMFSLAKQVQALGYQIAIHAIGDRANQTALDVLGRLRALDGQAIHRIEHAQIVQQKDWPRFARIGVIASMQPTHCTSDMGWVEKRLGAERLTRAYPWRSLLKNKARLAFGSDAPVESENPWLGIYAAITRQNPQGLPAKGFMPQEKLTLNQAFKAFSSDAADAGRQKELGVIKEGARADLTIVNQNPYELSLNKVIRLKNLATVVNGKVVWRSPIIN